MTRTFTLKFGDHADQPEKKKQYNEQHFTVAAPKYDFSTKAMSLGRDTAWKKRLVASLPVHTAPFCVDLACGTGDVSFLLAEKYPGGTVVGLDLTESMLEIAAQRNGHSNLTWTQRDMCSTGLKSRSADIVTGSYALRNAPDLDSALDEIHRILKPNGVAAFLDFSKPPARFKQILQYGLMKSWGGLWGLLLHGNYEVHGYIAESLKAFPDRVCLRKCLASKGFQIIECQRFYFGMLELLVFKSR